MPLPVNDTPWPPRVLADIAPVMAQWSAWYEGTPEALQAAYAQSSGPRTVSPSGNPNRVGGIRGFAQRLWWGRPVTDLTLPQRDMLHVPIAADLCQASADLLFADQPTLTVTDKGAQDRLDELADDGLYSTLAEAAELGAALGSTYLRVAWDRDQRPDAPFLTAVDADGALPDFSWGQLRAVTFWTVVDSDGQRVRRYLERHELDAAGNGVVLHALYEGTEQNLGHVVPLAEGNGSGFDTAGIVAAMNADGVVDTATPGLAVVFVPNQRPQRRWRKHPLGRNLGRSDLDGVEGLMDALDETYSSWMRDVRLGKARIVIAKSMLENLGPGEGAVFDAEREVYSPVNALLSAKDGGLPIEQVQFAIRVEEHSRTAEQLREDILRTAGYSAQTFGEGGDEVSNRTATEVNVKERRSLLTRDRKIRHWTPGLADALEKLLAIDSALFAGGYTPSRPDVKFSDGVQDSPLQLAQTALALRQAEAASDEVIVLGLHPDWDDAQVQAEVAKIQSQRSMAAPDPTMPGNPFGQADQQGQQTGDAAGG